MATPEPIGITTCAGCGRDADAKKNAGGFLYYHCGCGHSERTHNHSASRAFEKKMRPLNFSREPEKSEGQAMQIAGKQTEKTQEITGKSEISTPQNKKYGFC